MTPVLIIFGAAVRPDGEPSGAMRDRVEAAVRFGSTLAQPLYMPTGGVGRFGAAEAEVMARLLRGHGVAQDQIQQEPTGINTIRSVRACAGLLHGHQGPVYAATSAYHLPRCLVLLHLAGLNALACPPPRGPSAERLLRRWYWHLREVPAVPVDAALLAWWRLRGRL